MVPRTFNAVASVLMLCIIGAFSYRTGAPNNDIICSTMKPGHKAAPQVLPVPFEFIVNKDRYVAGDTLQITIRATGDHRIKGFLIQARRADSRLNTNEPIGYFISIPGTATTCSALNGNGLTHRGGSPGSDDDKQSLSLSWRANTPSEGHIVFKYTIVSDVDTYWVMESSRVIQDRRADPLPTKPPPPPEVNLLSEPITVDSCGKQKGCYRNPAGCGDANEPACEMFVSWKDAGDWINFELSGLSEGWIAVGLSHDKKMGDDDVVECVHVEDENRVVVRKSYNGDGNKMNTVLDPPTLALVNLESYKGNGMIKCRFSRKKLGDSDGRDYVFDLSGSIYHVLMAKGRVMDNMGEKEMHNLEAAKHPFVSKVKVSLEDMNVDIDGTARYALVKIHAILMLIGWMMCACTAVLLAKYYKPMWPNKKVCGERPWFAFHRALQIINLFCTIIAFILIFVHAGGYSQMPHLPDKAHPILGIITTCLCVLNPLIALCRPNPNHTYRPVFNWIHWFFGLVAMVLSTPTIFIGLNLPKAHVPWWATWVMVAFFLFHFVIELILEIHGCLNARKQKQRNQEYDIRKKSDGRGDYYAVEPEPVGTRFKKTILSLYLFVSIIIGIVMVITIAVS